jgi:hypothetical protein
MELTIAIELILKALLPLLVKEFFSIISSNIETPHKSDESPITSIEALIDLNNSLKEENKFQRDQIDTLRNMVGRIQSRLPLDDGEP